MIPALKPSDQPLLTLLDIKAFDAVVPSGSAILVGVSGGADSVALLRALSAVAQARTLCLAVVHINHCLRPESDEDENFVRELCRELNTECHVRRLSGADKPGNVSPEQFWRRLRYDEFEALLKQTDSQFLALGHTVDDLAETFLFHLTRGTGVDGLVFDFFKQSGELPIIRPMWKTARSKIEDTLRAIEQKWVCDPTNDDMRYSRNLIRHQVLPALAQINPAVAQAISNVSERLSEVATRASGSQTISGAPPGAETMLQQEDLRTAAGEPALAVAVRNYVTEKTSVVMDRRQTEQAVSIIQKRGTGIVALAGGKTLVINQNSVWVYPGANPSNKELAEHHTRLSGALASEIPGHEAFPVFSPAAIIALDGARWTVEWRGATSLVFRNRELGDRIGSKLLAKLLIEYKLPWYVRDFMVVAVDEDGQILAVLGAPPALNEWIARRRNRVLRFSATRTKPAA